MAVCLRLSLSVCLSVCLSVSVAVSVCLCLSLSVRCARSTCTRPRKNALLPRSVRKKSRAESPHQPHGRPLTPKALRVPRTQCSCAEPPRQADPTHRSHPSRQPAWPPSSQRCLDFRNLASAGVVCHLQDVRVRRGIEHGRSRAKASYALWISCRR